MGLTDPLPVQYVRWLGGSAARAIPARRSARGQPVGVSSCWHSLPITIELAVLATLIATIVAIPLGVVSAVRRDTGDRFLPPRRRA